MDDLVVAIDLGGTQVRAALCDTHGKILARAREDTRASEGPEAGLFSELPQPYARLRTTGRECAL